MAAATYAMGYDSLRENEMAFTAPHKQKAAPQVRGVEKAPNTADTGRANPKGSVAGHPPHHPPMAPKSFKMPSMNVPSYGGRGNM